MHLILSVQVTPLHLHFFTSYSPSPLLASTILLRGSHNLQIVSEITLPFGDSLSFSVRQEWDFCPFYAPKQAFLSKQPSDQRKLFPSFVRLQKLFRVTADSRPSFSRAFISHT